MRSLKASLDPLVYRNIDLDVWENFRSEQQNIDRCMAVSYQFKPGDICIATFRESEECSKQVIVKVQKVLADKCKVFPEDKDTIYYVHHTDLQPIVNGEMSDYRSLPGYYNKFDNDQEFQSQKRRKHRKSRDEERKTNEFSNNNNNNNQTGKSRVEKDNRNRRNNNNTRKEKSASPTKQLKEGGVGVKKPEKVENQKTPDLPSPTVSNVTNSTDENGAKKVAKPAETSAAFWGRMRNNGPQQQSQTPTPSKPVQSPDENNSPSNLINNDNHNKQEPERTTPVRPVTIATNNENQKTSILPRKTTNTQSSNNTKQIQPVQLKSSSQEPNRKESTSPNNDNQLPTTQQHNQQKVILTSQPSLKVNKARDNIITSSAKIESNTGIRNSSVPVSTVVSTSVQSETLPLDEKPATPVKEEKEPNKPINGLTAITSKLEKLNTVGSTPPESNLRHSPDGQQQNTTTMSPVEAPSRPPKLGRVKKKVSFGSTTEIIEKVQPQLFTPSNQQQQQHHQIDAQMISSSERGKIHIPRDHIVKHMGQSYTPLSIKQQYQTTAINTQAAEQSTIQQPVRIIQQPAFVQSSHNPVPTFYQQAPQSQVFPLLYQPGGNVTDLRTISATFSQDPEAKDLPEGTTVYLILCVR